MAVLTLLRRAFGAALLIGLASLAGVAASAEPELVLAAATTSQSQNWDGELVKTSEGFGWAGDWGVKPLQGGKAYPVGDLESALRVGPNGRWQMLFRDDGLANYFDNNRRGEVTMSPTDPQRQLGPRGILPVEKRGWPAAAAEGPDGRVAILMWSRGLPLAGPRRHRMLLWSPTQGVVIKADWPKTYIPMTRSRLVPAENGSWRLLAFNVYDPVCPYHGLAFFRIAPDMRMTGRTPLCWPGRRGRPTIGAGGVWQGQRVWPVVRGDDREVQLLRVVETAEGVSMRLVASLPGDTSLVQTAVAFDPVTGDSFVGHERKAKVMISRVTWEGMVTQIHLPVASCDGRTGNYATVHLEHLDGQTYAAVYTGFKGGSCINVWRL